MAICFKVFKKFLLAFLLFIMLSAFAENKPDSDESLDLFEDEKEIACKDLPEAFKKYEEDNQLHKHSLQSVLSETVKALEKFFQKRDIIQSDLVKIIKELKNAKNIISDNQLSLASQSDNLLFYMEKCLKKPGDTQKN